MNWISDAWMEFNGIKCSAKGLRLLEIPQRPVPECRGQMYLIPGRSGYIWQPENAYDPIDISVSMQTIDGFDAAEMEVWLSGEHALRFCDDQTHIYKARRTQSYVRSNPFASFDTQRMSVIFSCQPWRYIYPAVSDQTITASGATVSNPGSVESEPCLTINGTGDCTIQLGNNVIQLSGLTDGIVIDSETRECLSLDGETIMPSYVSMDDYPLLAPGSTTLTWTGNITSIVIAKRARCV